MKNEYKKCFIKSLMGILFGPIAIILNLIACYVIFGQEWYVYEITQYTDINNLIIRSIFLIISFIIFLFIAFAYEVTENLKKEMSFKKYFIVTMILMVITPIIYSSCCIVIVDKFIKDKCFIATFVIVTTILGLIWIGISSFNKAILERKINEKLKEKMIKREN